MSDALGTPGGVVSAVDHRLALAGLIHANGAAPSPRVGVLAGPGSNSILSGTSATGTMTVNVAAHHWVTSRSAADGVYIGAKEAAGTVNIAAAPGANSRIDVVYVKQNDAASTISPDGSTGDVYGVVTGTAAASPTKPALPVGATEIGTVTVAAGATSTNGAGVTIATTAPQVVARGARVPVRNSTERNALTQYAGLEVYRIDSGDVELSNGSSWATTFDSSAPTVTPHAVLTGTSTQSIASGGSFTALTLGTQVMAQGMTTTLGTGRINVSSSGVYAVSGSVVFAGAASGRRLSGVLLNGTLINESQGRVDPAAANTTPVPTSLYLVTLTAGNYLQLGAFQDSGGPVNVDRTQSFLQAHRIA